MKTKIKTSSNHESNSENEIFETQRELKIFKKKQKKTTIKLKQSQEKLTRKIRVLNCIYKIIEILNYPNKTIEEILNGTMKNIQQAMQFPKICKIKVLFNDKLYQIEKFNPTSWYISKAISIQNKKLKIYIYYLEKNVFFKEERKLLKNITNLLKSVFQFKLIYI